MCRVPAFAKKTRWRFLEVRVAKRSGTNPTAAAIGALRTLNALTEEVAVSAAQFLIDIQTDEGGFQANSRMPIADLLSTFTACVTLWDLEQLELIDIPSAYRYGKECRAILWICWL